MFYADAPIFVEWPASEVCRVWELQTRGLAAESSKASQRGGGTACPKEADTSKERSWRNWSSEVKKSSRSACEDGWVQPFALEARQRHTAEGNSSFRTLVVDSMFSSKPRHKIPGGKAGKQRKHLSN